MDCGASRLLCSWDSPGKHTGVGCHALLQGILPNQGSNLRLLHHRWVLYHWASREALSRCPQSFGDLPYDRICHTLPLCLSQLSSSQKGRHCRALPPSLGTVLFSSIHEIFHEHLLCAKHYYKALGIQWETRQTLLLILWGWRSPEWQMII